MKIHITNKYCFDKTDVMMVRQHRFAKSGKELDFREMGIFTYPVETDMPNELSKRIDGIVSAVESEDIIIIQLPTGNGLIYEQKLFYKIKACRDTKVILLFHDIQMFYDIAIQNGYRELCKNADVVILPTKKEGSIFANGEIQCLLFGDNIQDKETFGNDFFVKKLLMDALEKVFLYQKSMLLSNEVETEIQIGFGLHDKDGNYSVWVGAAMQSIIEHTSAKICFHILIDDSVSEANKKRLTQVALDGGHRIRFHLLDKKEFISVNSRVNNYTIGTMFRVVLPEILSEISKIIYLDADIIVNRNIKDLWDIDISGYYMAAVPDMITKRRIGLPLPVKRNVVDADEYFNAGVLMMNLDLIRKKHNMKEATLLYLMEDTETLLPDQDALNVLYNKSVLLLDESWNYFVRFVRESQKQQEEEKIYHFLGTRCHMHKLSIADEICFETIGRTPWGKEKTRELLRESIGRIKDRAGQLEKVLKQLAASNKKRIFYGQEVYAMRNMYELLHVKEGDYRVLLEPINDKNSILQCKSLTVLEEEADEYIVFVLPEADGGTSMRRLEQMGLVNEKDFFVIPRLLPPELGGYI